MTILSVQSRGPAGAGRPRAARGRSRDAGTEALLGACGSGSPEAREELLRRYMPFVLKVASRASRRFVHLGQDDEASVALIAFNEAITIYRRGSRTAFTSFAEIVIRRRLIDHFRRCRQVDEIPLSAFEREDEEGEVWNPVDLRAAQSSYAEEAEVESRRQDLTRFNECLRAYGTGLDEIARKRPRHHDARQRALSLAREVVRRPEWLNHLRQRHELPLKEMADCCRVSRKTLERRRQYIIGLVVLQTEDLPTLRSWIADAEASPRRPSWRPLAPQPQV